MRKRKQAPESNKRQKSSAERQPAHAESTEPFSRQHTPRRRGMQLMLDVQNSPEAPSAIMALDTIHITTTGSNFCLFLNITAVPRDNNGGAQDRNGSGEANTNTFLVHLIETFLNTVFFFRQGTPSASEDSGSAEYASAIRDLVISIFNMLNENIKGKQKVISAEDLAKIPVVKCGAAEEGTCSICLCGFAKEENVRLLKCQHKFHCECVDPWLLESADTCPMCRTPLV
jgi:hypothetical protein